MILRSMRTRLSLLAAVLTGVLSLSLGLVSPAQASEPASDPHAAAFEVDFLTGMIDHHEMAVMMAQPCLDKAVHEELASMCQSIITSQSAQIEMMQGWLQDWYGTSHEPTMTKGQMRSMARLDRLTGAAYEIAFMRSMIRHHWGAVREASRCLARAEHPELLALCGRIERAQLVEIATMQRWLAQWYDAAGGRPARTA
ncbi:hypothetical protein N864_23400 [Intrasporangium chromatireducens Q5-1]|uniref:DUF305 domain-containing protein n=1 Tax=Intrasporangium chromatireducens Q5-1 TaxID=584657 RepID=W9GSF6_9MICO|nr:DUF305 domain-containing protein [Intrasporangium chromatireducens]EWT07763.1 hypothetical protein N864_23400 [Intrasporangium chromatireducens Q5-1]